MGKFIAIEGLDGTGKATQTALLESALEKKGASLRRLDFPNYDGDGSALVKLYLGGGLGSDPNAVNAYAASSFFAADRYISYKLDWEKDAADPNRLIIANRYTTANAYHQLSKLPREEWDAFLAWLDDYEFSRLALPRPDLVLLLIAPSEASLEHIAKRSAETGVKRDIHEADAEYLGRCYDAALYAADKLGWTVIDCCENGEFLSREAIFRKIADTVNIKLNIEI